MTGCLNAHNDKQIDTLCTECDTVGTGWVHGVEKYKDEDEREREKENEDEDESRKK